MGIEWLKQLKVGDRVIVVEYHRFTTPQYKYRSETVERITPTGQLKISNCTANFKDGTMLGSTGQYATSGTYLEQHEPHRVAEINAMNHRHRMLKRIRDVSWSTIENNKLERIISILDTGV